MESTQINTKSSEATRTRYYKCAKCGTMLHEEIVIWALPDGTLNTDTGEPYCDACLPEQPDEE